MKQNPLNMMPNNEWVYGLVAVMAAGAAVVVTSRKRKAI